MTTAGLIAASTGEGRWVPCTEAQWRDPARTGPCVDRGRLYLKTADTLTAASMTGGLGIALAATVIAVRRRGATEAAEAEIAQA